MLLIGQGERTQVIGPAEKEHCLRCDEEREFVPQLRYSYGQFNLIFGFIYDRRYLLACPECNHGWFLDRVAAEQLYRKPAIPFHLRYGWIVLIALACLVAAAAYGYRHAS